MVSEIGVMLINQILIDAGKDGRNCQKTAFSLRRFGGDVRKIQKAATLKYK